MRGSGLSSSSHESSSEEEEDPEDEGEEMRATEEGAAGVLPGVRDERAGVEQGWVQS